MKTKITLVLLVLVLVCLSGNTQTIWTGPPTTFIRPDGEAVNWYLVENQDLITDNVWITRASNHGIFNIKTESVYIDEVSPGDTEWTFGTAANYIGYTFKSWVETIDRKPLDMVGKDMVLHLITDDIYIDIKFLSWTTGDGLGNSGGGGFSYERATDQSLSTNKYDLNNEIKVHPNPSHDFIQITGLSSGQNFKIHNVLGNEILHGNIEKEGEINIQNLIKGIYVIHFENGTALKFVKN